MQELERQRQILCPSATIPRFPRKPSPAPSTRSSRRRPLLAMAGKTGQYLRENEWLMNIRSRAAIPGGACEFDLPSHHHWLNREVELRRRDLMSGWVQPLLPIRDGLAIVLRLLRAQWPARIPGGPSRRLPADHGRAHGADDPHPPSGGANVRAETSANKYALNIRLMHAETVTRPGQVDIDVPFELTFCNL